MYPVDYVHQQPINNIIKMFLMNTVVNFFDMLILHRSILSVGLSVNNAFIKCFFF